MECSRKFKSQLSIKKIKEEIKNAYIEISKKYHPDMNGESEEGKAFCTECMRIINQVYERFEKGDIPESVVQNKRTGPFKYTTYFGEEKSFDDYNEFLFNYGKYCYYAAKSFYDMDDKMKDSPWGEQYKKNEGID